MKRRDALVTIAAAPAALAQGQNWIALLADVMIPRTDTPGASEAGVPAVIARRMAGNKALNDLIAGGPKLLDAAAGEPFFQLAPARQLALLTAREADPGPLGIFIRVFKGLVIDGYYSSKEGLAGELGWHGNTFVAEWKGCTHPEHQ